jgi:long-chain fatty acid transport protein
MGGVYVASSTSVVDALSTNPAGLSFLHGRNLNLDADAIFARGSFTDSANTSAPLTNSPAVIPYGAFGMPIDKSRFSFGGPAVAGRLALCRCARLCGCNVRLAETIFGNLRASLRRGLGSRLEFELSIGATVGADYNSNTLEAPYIFQSQPVLAGLKTLLDMNTTGYGWNGSVGVIARPTKKLQAGLAWKSRTVINTTGAASGDAYGQFAALGVNAPANFTYNAAVRNVLPQSVDASVAWQANHWLLAFQTDWVWHDSFAVLPVTLTNGTNAVLNSPVNGTSLSDGVPLAWKDQYVFHVGAERGVTESITLRAGYSHANNPVPSSTLTPLTRGNLHRPNLNRSDLSPR